MKVLLSSFTSNARVVVRCKSSSLLIVGWQPIANTIIYGGAVMTQQMLDFLALLYQNSNRYTSIKYTKVGTTWIITYYDSKMKQVYCKHFPVVLEADNDS